jgi:plastocyanin
VPGHQLIRLVQEYNEGRAACSPLIVPQRQLGRREFVAALGLAAAGLIEGCSRADRVAAPKAPTGRIEGTIVDSGGSRQPSLGRILLMYSSGQQTGRFVDVDATGRFAMADVTPGNWQLRFHAPGIAYVPEVYEHPRHVTVAEHATTTVQFIVEHGWEDGAEMIEIYLGDYFFQEQPLGRENAETVVKLGVPVCWYNVGSSQHTVTGPWWDSGVLERTGSFIWVPDRIGTFPYFCKFHRSQMIATLRVTA